MPRSGQISRNVHGTSVTGLREAGEVFLAATGALNNVHGGAPLVYSILNEQYRQKFRHWEGRGKDGSDYMVDTGATRSAWTEDHAMGAIREAHGNTIQYGSSIWHNKFHWHVLTSHSTYVDNLITETLADYFAPEQARFTRGYYQTRNGKRVFVRSYVSRGRLATPEDN